MSAFGGKANIAATAIFHNLPFCESDAHLELNPLKFQTVGFDPITMILIRGHTISDDDWAEIVASAHVNNLPRQEISGAIGLYHSCRTAITKGQPKATRDVLIRLSKQATRLSNDIAILLRNPCAAVVLTRASVDKADFAEAMNDRLADRELLADQHQLRALANRFALAASKIGLGSPGRTKSRIQLLFIKQLADIYQRCSGEPISRSHKRHHHSRDFIISVCRAADPSIGIGSIDEAMKRLIKSRGGKGRSQKS